VIHEITDDTLHAKRTPVPFAALLKGQGGRCTPSCTRSLVSLTTTINLNSL